MIIIIEHFIEDNVHAYRSLLQKEWSWVTGAFQLTFSFHRKLFHEELHMNVVEYPALLNANLLLKTLSFSFNDGSKVDLPLFRTVGRGLIFRYSTISRVDGGVILLHWDFLHSAIRWSSGLFSTYFCFDVQLVKRVGIVIVHNTIEVKTQIHQSFLERIEFLQQQIHFAWLWCQAIGPPSSRKGRCAENFCWSWQKRWDCR